MRIFMRTSFNSVLMSLAMSTSTPGQWQKSTQYFYAYADCAKVSLIPSETKLTEKRE